MKVLIDTQCWLWWFLSPQRLKASASKLISDPRNEIFFSAASSWEISIKAAIGKLRLPLPPKVYIPTRLKEQNMSGLSITHLHAFHVAELPRHHQDPFDRLLIAQAQVENMALLTADPFFKKYDVKVIWATAE